MAKSNFKRIKEQNRRLVENLRKYLIVSNLLSLSINLLVNSNRKAYMVKYSISTVLSMVCYKTLIKSSSGGEDYQSIDDLTTGAYQYLFDFCYLSCLVWVGCLLFESSWKIYLLVPIYLVFKVARFAYSILKIKKNFF